IKKASTAGMMGTKGMRQHGKKINRPPIKRTVETRTEPAKRAIPLPAWPRMICPRPGTMTLSRAARIGAIGGTLGSILLPPAGLEVEFDILSYRRGTRLAQEECAQFSGSRSQIQSKHIQTESHDSRILRHDRFRIRFGRSSHDAAAGAR